MKKIFIFLGIILIGLVIYFFVNRNASTVGKLQHYNSEKLGISFDYVDRVGPDKVEISESGNVIEVLYQSLEVLEKDSQQTLSGYIMSLLSGMDKKCSFKFEESNRNSYVYIEPKNTSPITSLGLGDTEDVNTDCITKYAGSNGVVYFAMNNEYPGKIILVNVGQDASIRGDLSEDNYKPWFDTIKINK